MAKLARRVGPFINVGVPLACEDLSQTELVRPVIFLIRLVPRRPKNERQRAVPPDNVEIVHGKILFSPVARRSDDRLVLAHHLLEILDRLQRDVVLRISEIHKRTRVSAVLGNHHLDGAIRIDLRDRDVLAASDQRKAQSDQCNDRTKNHIDTHSSPQISFRTTLCPARASGD